MRANAKARKRLLASLLALVLVAGMLPAGAFAESEPPALGAGVAAENVKGDEGSAREEAGDPGDPNELPGSAEDKKQGNPAPSPSVNNQETPPAAPMLKSLSDIRITTPPTKTTYTAGDSFDPAGMVVTATYSDGTTAPVTGYTYTPTGALTTGDTSITVSYTEDGVKKNATQSITVAVPTRTVTLAANPASLNVSLEGGGSYPAGTEITVKTEKYINGIEGVFKFEGWYAGDTKVGGDVAYTFTVTGDTSLTAKFKKIAVFHYGISSGAFDLGEGIEIGDIRLENVGYCLPYEEHEKITLTWNGNQVGQWWNKTNPMIAVDSTELGVGKHTLTLNYPGSDEYCAASADISVTVVKKLALSLEDFAPAVAAVNTPYTVSGRIVDENGDPYSGKLVHLGVQINGNYLGFIDLGAVTTNQNGAFSKEISGGLPTAPGTRQIWVDTRSYDDAYKHLSEFPVVTFVTDLYTVTVTAEPAEGGTVAGGGSYLEGESATLVAAAAEGYEFDGWWDGEDNVSWYEEYTIPEVTGDMTLTARFVKMWTVTVDMNGGTIGGAARSAMEFRDGHVGRIPTAEDMAGWVADGTWITGPAGSEYVGAEITDASGTKAYRPGDAYTVVGDAAIKVLWKPAVVPPEPPAPAPPAVCTITYDLNGGTLDGKTGTVTVEAESGSTITLPAPTREGYTFDYWKGSRYSAGDSYTVEGDHTLTAQWRKDAPAAPAAPAGKGDTGKGDTGKASPGTSASDAGKSSPGKSSPGKALPKTGDGSNLPLWLAMTAAALALALLAVRKLAKRRT